jgi:hypothetical protein
VEDGGVGVGRTIEGHEDVAIAAHLPHDPGGAPLILSAADDIAR